MTRRRVRAALGSLAAVASLALSACGGATNWWMFQGDLSHNGRNHRLNSLQKHTLRWNVPLTTGPLHQLTQPVFGNSKILVGSSEGTLYALWPGDGSTVWSFAAPAGNGFAGSVAAVDDRIYAATNGTSPNAYALDESTGAMVWQTPIPGGSRSSIAVAGRRVLVHDEQQHRLYALNAATGAIVWSAPLSPGIGASSGSSPAAALGLVFVGSDDGLFALNFATGAQMWKFPLASPPSWSSPVVFVPPSGVPLVYINTVGGPGVGPPMLHAVNALTGAQVWSYTGMGLLGTHTSALADGRLFIFDYLTLRALNAVTGAPLWAYTPPMPGSAPTGALAVGDRLVYYADAVTVRGVELTTGKLVWDAPIPGNGNPNSPGNSPGIEFEYLVVPNKGHVYAFR